MPYIIQPKHGVEHRWKEQLILWEDQLQLFYDHPYSTLHYPYPNRVTKEYWMLREYPMHYATRAEAHKASEPAIEIVKFVPTENESDVWQTRERQRFADGEYIRTPWHSYDNLPLHFAHLSVKQPGLIAYTKDVEHGIADRQTAIKPGRYLEEFMKDMDFSREQIANFVGQCGANCNTLQITQDAKEIRRIFQHGPRSCMSPEINDHHNWVDWPIHPCEVYAGPDLAIAYYGPIDNVSARAVVWPENKLWTRIYGNEPVLSAMLTAAGYEESESAMHGARVHKIQDKRGHHYLMPYVDGVEKMSEAHGGKYFVLDDDGDFDCHTTGGYAGEAEEENTENCANCGHDYDPENDEAYDGYCPRCSQDRGSCERCSNSRHMDDLNEVDGCWYCESCTTRLFNRTCESCSEIWIEQHLDQRDIDSRRDLNVDMFCVTCAPDVRYCATCDQHTDTTQDDGGAEHCMHCTRSWTCTETEPLPLEASPAVDFQTILDTLPVYPFGRYTDIGTVDIGTTDRFVCGVPFGPGQIELHNCCRQVGHTGEHASIGQINDMLFTLFSRDISAPAMGHVVYLPLPSALLAAGISVGLGLTYRPAILTRAQHEENYRYAEAF